LDDNASISAYLDDSEFDQEDKYMTLNLKGKFYNLTLGDFKIDKTENPYAVFNKKVQGVEFTGILPAKQSIYLLYTRSKGKSEVKLFKGRGNTKEYRLDPDKTPVVENSEVVKIGSKILSRGQDYIIDNDEGTIMIKTHLLPIESDVIVTVSYEYEEGSEGYKRNLFGTRYSKNWGKKNNFSIDLFGLKDNKNKKISGDNTSEDNNRNPISHFVLGEHLDFYKKGFNIIFNHAGSYKDNNLKSNLLSSDKMKKAKVYDLGIAKSSPDMVLKLNRSRRDPDFEVIGMKDSYRYNSLDSYKASLWPNGKVRPSFSYLDGSRIIFSDPELNISESTSPIQAHDLSKSASLNIDMKKGLSVAFSANRNTKINIASKLENYDNTNRLSMTKKWKKLNTMISLDERDFEQKFDESSSYQLTKSSFNMDYSYDRNSVLNLMLSEQKKEDTKENEISSILTSGIGWNSHLGRNFRSNLSFRRREENIPLSSTNKTSNAIDGRLNYSPNTKLYSSFKYLQQEMTTLKWDDANNKYNETPVLDKDISINLRFLPIENLENNLSLSEHSKENTNLSMYESKRYNVRNKINLHYHNHTITYLTDFSNLIRELTGITKRKELQNKIEWLMAASNSTSTSLSYSHQKNNDLILDSNDETIQKIKASMEHFFSSAFSLNFSTGYDIIDKKSESKERRELLSSGFEYHISEKFIIGWDLERESSKKDTSMVKLLNRIRLNLKPKDDIDISSYIDLINNKSSSSDSYKARLFNLEAVFRF